MKFDPTPKKAFIGSLITNFFWINCSEIFRYFVFVMPMMRGAFPELDVAPMNLTVFAIWGIWDTLLILMVTGFFWLYLERFGATVFNALIAGSLATLSIFGILWLGIYNMNLAPIQVVLTALPLAWLELVIASLIVQRFMKKFLSSAHFPQGNPSGVV